MNEIQLKSEFHKLIDEFKDVNVLEDFYEVIQEYSQHNQKDIIDELSDEQRARLFQSIKQSEVGQTITHKKALQQIEQCYMN